MGFLDKLKLKATEVKEKAVEAVNGRGPQIKGGIDKAGDFVDKKTKGKYSDKIAKGTKKAGEAVDKIEKPDADPLPPTGQTPPPGTTPPPAPERPTGHTPPSVQTPPPSADDTP
ncbi:MAG: antitoxin [Nocardioidaceae bacterium]